MTGVPTWSFWPLGRKDFLVVYLEVRAKGAWLK